MQVYYAICLILSVIGLLIFKWRWNRDTDINITFIFLFIPISEIGYLMLSMSSNLEEAILANKIIYLGGCFLPMFITFGIMNMFQFKFPRIIGFSMTALTVLVYSGVLMIGVNKAFYKSVEYLRVNGNVVLKKEYGPLHTVFYAMIGLYTILGVGLVIYSMLKRKGIVSYRTAFLLILAEVIAVISFFFGRAIMIKGELLPASYLLFQILFLSIMERTGLYNISITEASALIDKAENGFIALDLHRRFIGANITARKLFPPLANQVVDEWFNVEKGPLSNVDEWLNEFDRIAKNKRGRMNEIVHDLEHHGRFYKFVINYIRDDRRIKGYQIIVVDETQERQYTALLEKYNSDLAEEVEKKTEHIQEIQDKMVLGLAEMVEGRDLSTGGHIKRTSQGIRILMNEMLRDPESKVDKHFAKLMIKAAPMHDLGKIAVDDKILRKNGRFEPKEYEQMKLHAPKGAEIVRKVLTGVEDPEFALLAENVAHYHHERVDGSGYPDHLKGDEIPYEARIMAIADVYDALVSKRCYKDKYSFEKAYEIIEEGMGTQFDESLNKYFLAARPALEAYYSGLEDE
jgi:Response regulator containing a CheY-like receiver domain and an HD-GYP domain